MNLPVTRRVVAALAFAGLLPALIPARAQQALPRPPEPFIGKIASSAAQSTSAWLQQPKAPPGAPNVVVVLLDDVGFRASSIWAS
jgi:hypothetical protein